MRATRTFFQPTLTGPTVAFPIFLMGGVDLRSHQTKFENFLFFCHKTCGVSHVNPCIHTADWTSSVLSPDY